MKNFSASTTLVNAASLLPKFVELLESKKYENRGIFFSELLFLWASAGTLSPRQIVESGRARGLSTLALTKLFPTSRVVSIEYEPEHPDARFAEQTLGGTPNLALLYGNANVLLPELLLPGDIALIDGPKGMEAVILALRALATGKPAAIFVHDMYKGQAARKALEQKVPAVFFSDDPAFVEKFRSLDEQVWNDKRPAGQDKKYGDGKERSYGPTLACIPRQNGVDYSALATSLARMPPLKRIKQSWKALTGKGKAK